MEKLTLFAFVKQKSFQINNLEGFKVVPHRLVRFAHRPVVPASANRKLRFANPNLFSFPIRKPQQAVLFPGNEKPAPFGAGFLLDVVPHGLEPWTP